MRFLCEARCASTSSASSASSAPLVQWEVERSPEEFSCFFGLLAEASPMFREFRSSSSLQRACGRRWRDEVGKWPSRMLIMKLNEALGRWQARSKGDIMRARNGPMERREEQVCLAEGLVVGELFEAFLCPPAAARADDDDDDDLQHDCLYHYPESFERLLSDLESLNSKSVSGLMSMQGSTSMCSGIVESEWSCWSAVGEEEYACASKAINSRERCLSYSSFEEECKSDLDTPVARLHLRRYNSCAALKKPKPYRRRGSQSRRASVSDSIVKSPILIGKWGMDWAEKRRRGSESSTFSCGSQRFRFTKISAGCEGDLSPIVEDEWSDFSDGGFSSEDDEEVMSLFAPSGGIRRGGSVLKTYDYEYAAPLNSSGFRPFAVTVSTRDEVQDDANSGRWSPVSIPPSEEDQERLLSDLARYTNDLVVSASKIMCASDGEEE